MESRLETWLAPPGPQGGFLPVLSSPRLHGGHHRLQGPEASGDHLTRVLKGKPRHTKRPQSANQEAPNRRRAWAWQCREGVPRAEAEERQRRPSGSPIVVAFLGHPVSPSSCSPKCAAALTDEARLAFLQHRYLQERAQARFHCLQLGKVKVTHQPAGWLLRTRHTWAAF